MVATFRSGLIDDIYVYNRTVKPQNTRTIQRGNEQVPHL